MIRPTADLRADALAELRAVRSAIASCEDLIGAVLTPEQLEAAVEECLDILESVGCEEVGSRLASATDPDPEEREAIARAVAEGLRFRHPERGR